MRLEVDDTFFTICARDHLANRSVMKAFASLVQLAGLKVESLINGYISSDHVH
jgi:nucleolar pre-ribosomal-associated protein 1